ncbi:MAG TPA: hypothetical protein VH500_09165 [Nitrososphaeraceae archaeon]|jgi:hypothetical protein
MNTKLLIISLFILAGTLLLIYAYIQQTHISPTTFKHAFKVKEIYPTKLGGRVWSIDMNAPTNDRIFDPGSPISKQSDGSWQIDGNIRPDSKNEDQVRMTVGTPQGEEQWKNVEITGYARVLSADSNSDDLDWYARGGVHNSDVPCEGTALKGTISVDGEVSWLKEIWHTGGYTRPKDTHKATDSVQYRWIGWKVVMYNINDNKAVKMESYLDNNDDNHWKKVSELVDDGGWYARSSNDEFYSANCNRPKDYVITNSGPFVTFRSDNMDWDFADLSVREIQPPSH